MTDDEATIDVLDALADGVREMAAALDEAGASTPYLQGQLAYFEAVLDAAEVADDDERPRALLERVAADLDVAMDGQALADPPVEGRRAGVLAAWGLCNGYVEGFPAGAQAVMDTVDEAADAAPG